MGSKIRGGSPCENRRNYRVSVLLALCLRLPVTLSAPTAHGWYRLARSGKVLLLLAPVVRVDPWLIPIAGTRICRVPERHVEFSRPIEACAEGEPAYEPDTVVS